MARKHLREPKVDTELAYAYAKTDRLHDMEDFLGMTNVADVLEVGEKCFEDELYQAAKLLFTSISNWARLATTLIYLGENQGAVESARKAGNTQYVLLLGCFLAYAYCFGQGVEASSCCLSREGRIPTGMSMPHILYARTNVSIGANLWPQHHRPCRGAASDRTSL